MSTPSSERGLAASAGVGTPLGRHLADHRRASDHTGLSPQVPRTWENRFGFPAPTRLPSGHRRYTGADVRAVRRVLEERDRGMRLEQAIGVARRAEDVTDSGSIFAALQPAPPGFNVVDAHQEHPVGALVGDRGRGDGPGRRAACWWGPSSAAATSGSRPRAGGSSRAPLGRRWRWRTSRSTTTRPVPRWSRCSPDSPLLREWIVVHDAPTFAAALVAWELPGQGDVPDAERHFEALWTVDGRIVRDAAAVCADAAVAAGSAARGSTGAGCWRSRRRCRPRRCGAPTPCSTGWSPTPTVRRCAVVGPDGRGAASLSVPAPRMS